jgi:hypothetical protein
MRNETTQWTKRRPAGDQAGLGDRVAQSHRGGVSVYGVVALTESGVDELQRELNDDPSASSADAHAGTVVPSGTAPNNCTLPASASRHSHEKHQPRDETLPCQLYDLEERSEDGHPDDGHEQPRLELVGDPEPGGGLVEAVALLEDKGVVVAPREGGEGGEEGEQGDPEQGAGDLAH